MCLRKHRVFKTTDALDKFRRILKRVGSIPGKVLRVPAGWGSQISIQSAHEGGKVVSPTHRPPLPPRKYSWYSFLLDDELTPRPEGLCQCKNSSDTIGDRTRDLSTCSAVPQQLLTPHRNLHIKIIHIKTASKTQMKLRNAVLIQHLFRSSQKQKFRNKLPCAIYGDSRWKHVTLRTLPAVLLEGTNRTQMFQPFYAAQQTTAVQSSRASWI